MPWKRLTTVLNSRVSILSSPTERLYETIIPKRSKSVDFFTPFPMTFPSFRVELSKAFNPVYTRSPQSGPQDLQIGHLFVLSTGSSHTLSWCPHSPPILRHFPELSRQLNIPDVMQATTQNLSLCREICSIEDQSKEWKYTHAFGCQQSVGLAAWKPSTANNEGSDTQVRESLNIPIKENLSTPWRQKVI